MAKHVFICTDKLGRGDDELAALLMHNFVYSLARADQPPAAVTLMNGGVRLACAGSSSIDDLSLLSEKGVPVRACGTCLEFLGLAGQLVVGETGNMRDTVEALLGDEVLTVT